MLVMKVFKPDIWAVGNTAISLSEAMSENTY